MAAKIKMQIKLRQYQDEKLQDKKIFFNYLGL